MCCRGYSIWHIYSKRVLTSRHKSGENWESQDSPKHRNLRFFTNCIPGIYFLEKKTNELNRFSFYSYMYSYTYMSHFSKYFHLNSRCRDSPRTEAYIPCTVALYRVVLTGIWQKYQSSIKVHSPLIYIYKQYSKFRSMICLHYFPLFLPFFQISGFIVVLSLTIYSIYILRSYFWHRHTTNLSIGEL